MGLEQGDPRRIDHVDMIRGNNQRYNLRIATHTQNMWNRPAQKNNTSGYKGVTWHRQALRWQARIRANKKTISLGLFDTPREAHEAYKTAADKYHGEFANYG